MAVLDKEIWSEGQERLGASSFTHPSFSKTDEMILYPKHKVTLRRTCFLFHMINSGGGVKLLHQDLRN